MNDVTPAFARRRSQVLGRASGILFSFFFLALIVNEASATTLSYSNSSAGGADNNTLSRTIVVGASDFPSGEVISAVTLQINFAKINAAGAANCPGPDGGGQPRNTEAFQSMTSGAGTNLTLFSAGTFTSNGTHGGTVTVTYDQTAASTIGGAAPTSGTFRPTSSLNNFQGENPAGTWTVRVGDTTTANPHCFNSYTLTITTIGAPGVPDLDAGSDTGISSTDDNTADNTPTFTISPCENGATVQLREGGVTRGSATCSAGSASVTSTTLTNGVHNLGARQVVGGATSSTSTTLAVTIDTNAPGAPGTPDLQATSDSGSSSTDNNTNITTPTFDISCTTGFPVELRESTTVLGTGTCAGGTVTITSSLLTDGTHLINARQSDVAGNFSSNSSNLSVVIDTAPPGAPGVPDLLAASDSGLSNTDDITNIAAGDYSVSCTVGTTVELREAGSTVGSASCGSSPVTITSSAFSEGVHTVTARQTDAAGNTGSESTGLNVTIDLTAPSDLNAPDLQDGSDTGSSISDNYTADNTPTFDVSGCEDGALVTLLINPTSYGTATCSGGTASVTATTVADGTFDFVVAQTDVAGNNSNPVNPLSVTIDTSLPAAPSTPDVQAASDSGTSNTDNITSVTTPTVDVSCEDGALVEVLLDGNLFGSGTCAASTVSITLSAINTDGTYLMTARQTDVAGNVSPESIGATLVIDTSEVAPGTPDLQAASDSGSSNSDDVTNLQTVTFDVNCDLNASVVLLENATPIGSATCSASPVAITVTSPLDEGVHSITAQQTDVAGNISPESSAISVTVDISAPNIPTTPDLNSSSDSGSSDTDNITNILTPQFDVACEDGAYVELLEGLTVVGSGTCSGGTVSLSLGTVTEAVHTYTARQTDPSGNQSSASDSITVTFDTTGPAATNAPDMDAASDTGNSSSDDLTSNTTPTFTVTGCEDGALVTLLISANPVGTGTCASGQVSIIVSPALSDGTYAISTTTTDVAGNLGTESATLSFTVDSTVPAAPGTPDLQAASDSGSDNTDDITNDTTPTFDLTCETDASVSLFVAGNTLIGTGTCVAGTVSITSPTLAAGTYSVTATQTDLAGNTSDASAALSVVIDVSEAAPGTPDLLAGSDSGSSSTDDLTNNTTPTVRIACADGDTVELVKGVTVLASGACVGTSIDLVSSALAEGANAVFARQTDIAGNLSPNSGSLTITVDTTAPTVPAFTAPTPSEVLTVFAPTFSGTGEVGSTVQVFEGATLLGTAVVNGSGVWSFTTTSTLSEGSHTVFAVATDAAGNVSSNSGNLTFSISNDPDGDGVLTAQEGSLTDDADGDGIPNYLDSDSRGATVYASSFRVPWNSFLRGVTIDEVRNNLSDRSIRVHATLIDINGVSHNSVDMIIPANGQQDLIVNDMDGFTVNSYGNVLLEGFEIGGAPLAAGSFDGQASVYRLQGTTFTSFDYAYAIPFSGAKKGTLCAGYNTYQPSGNPADQTFKVANFAQTSNFGPGSLQGHLLVYNQDGSTAADIELNLANNVRSDTSIHDIVGANRVGISCFVPNAGFENVELAFQVNRYYYLNSTFSTEGANTFAGAISVEGVKGRTGPLVLPMDTANGDLAIAEVANVLGSAISVTVEAYDSNGVLKDTLTTTLNAHATLHDIGNSFLTAGDVGTFIVKSTTDGALYAAILHYTRDASASVLSVRGLRSSDGLGTSLFGSLNSFLSQTCRVLVTNAGSSTESVDMTRFDSNGAAIGSTQTLSIPAHGTTVSNACDGLPANIYGKFQLVPQNPQATFASSSQRKQPDYTMATEVRP